MRLYVVFACVGIVFDFKDKSYLEKVLVSNSDDGNLGDEVAMSAVKV